MTGIKPLRKLQLGRETTAGTASVATTIWRGSGVIEDQHELKFAEEDIGYLTGVDRTYVPKLLGALAMDSVPATFEQLPHVFEAGIAALGTGVSDTGAGATGKIYTYTIPTTAVNTPKFYTIEGGDNQEAERIEYAFVEDFTLEGKGGEAVMMAANWKGRQVALNAFTTTATLPTVEEILFGKGKLFIDTAGGTAGTTQISSTLLAMSLKWKTGFVPVFTADGALYYTFVKQIAPEITLDLTLEHNTSAAAVKVDWRAQTPKLLQLKWEGTALGTAGTYTYKTAIITLAGRWEKISALSDQDGNDIVTGTFRARYNATAARVGQAIVVNEVASMP